MPVRAAPSFSAFVLLAALILAAIAPWLDPCIGPLRFVDCIDFEQSAAPNAFAPLLFCPLGVCDFFPSWVDRAARALVVVSILVGVGVAASREAVGERFAIGLAACVATCIVAAILTGLVYLRSGV